MREPARGTDPCIGEYWTGCMPAALDAMIGEAEQRASSDDRLRRIPRAEEAADARRRIRPARGAPGRRPARLPAARGGPNAAARAAGASSRIAAPARRASSWSGLAPSPSTPTGRVLILTPLAVGRQMRAEAAVMGHRYRTGRPARCSGHLDIANYQRLHQFDPQRLRRYRSGRIIDPQGSHRGHSAGTHRVGGRSSVQVGGDGNPGTERHHGAPDTCAVARHHDRPGGTGDVDGQRCQHGRPLLAPQGACRCGLLEMGADMGEHLPPAF